MKSKALTIQQINDVVPPDGSYTGIWGGYVVRFTAGDKQYIAQVENGIRTTSAVCSVIIKNGKMEVFSA